MKRDRGWRFLVVEDDYLQGDATHEALRNGFPGTRVNVITTEHEFREKLDRLAAKPPRENQAQAPARVLEEGDRRAGLRCCELVSQRAELESMPVLFFSHILDDELEEEIRKVFPFAHCLRRSEASTNVKAYRPLIERIQAILGVSSS